jgi:plastocyanin
MKLNLRVFKQGKPIYWIVGAVFLFIVFYLVLNKKPASDTTGTTSYVSTGPSEALQAQAMQINAGITTAQIGASVQVQQLQEQQSEANYALTAALAQVSAGQTVSLAGIDAQKAADAENAAANIQINQDNNSYGLETARVASQTQIGLAQISADTVTHQLDTNAAMFAEQSKNLVAQSLIASIANFKHKNEALDTIVPLLDNFAVTPANASIH